MADFSIWDASRPEGALAWQHAWERWPEREPFAHPDYARLFASPAQRAMCAHYVGPDGEVLFPFHWRALAHEPWSKGAPASDLSTPYGYGGPFVWGSPTPAFWGSLRDWARSEQVVSAFVRRSLFPDQLLSLPGGEVEIAPNVVRDLTAPVEEIWMQYEHKVRKNVNKARRAGLTTVIDPAGNRLADFVAVYRSTMARRDAVQFYDFAPEFFATLLSQSHGVLFHVTDARGEIVSSELVLVSKHHLYSFLGGTLPDALRLGANDLLKHAIIEWGQREGKRAFVLGGGYQPGDGIFRYKHAFAPSGVVPFKVGQLILDSEAYSSLVRRRREWESSQGRDWTPKPGFFPEYRAPSMTPE